MKNRYEEYLSTYGLNATDADESSREIDRRVRSLGFDTWWFSLLVPSPVTLPRLYLRGNFPEDWTPRGIHGGHPNRNPILRRAHYSSVPIVWESDGQSGDAEFWKRLAQRGSRYGWSKPTRIYAYASSVLTLARRNEPLSYHELMEKDPALTWLAYSVQQYMCKELGNESRLADRFSLTAREREVMLWTAEGKTASEIASILNIAETTVIFHISNAVRKTDSVNRAQAAAKVALWALF
ncbi:LuxR C-terminal-related transcriptional regulator [Trinickia acidisoli]|uniref:LuxR C-terminal-related transcriptional regulator n=1 Tax=Trinickia acidisoli TaxID=2767482 RepID=UPI001A8E525C|nr:LuxR C-terminal-related transcriptional regulator [Trinickia acidisoli]